MSCERYWREGIVLVERGEPDPHRDGCADCRCAHAASRELVRAIPLSASVRRDDANWQARVWRQIARDGVAPAGAASARRWWWSLGGALAVACTALALWRVLCPTTGSGASDNPVAQAGGDDRLPRIEIISGPIAMRSTSARVGDRVRISARLGDDVRVYRADRLVLRCTAADPSSECTRSAEGIVAETALTTAGEYQLAMIRGMVVEPVGTLSTDLAAVAKAGGDYELRELSIR